MIYIYIYQALKFRELSKQKIVKLHKSIVRWLVNTKFFVQMCGQLIMIWTCYALSTSIWTKSMQS